MALVPLNHPCEVRGRLLRFDSNAIFSVFWDTPGTLYFQSAFVWLRIKLAISDPCLLL